MKKQITISILAVTSALILSNCAQQAPAAGSSLSSVATNALIAQQAGTILNPAPSTPALGTAATSLLGQNVVQPSQDALLGSAIRQGATKLFGGGAAAAPTN